MLSGDAVGTGEVGDRARDAHDAVMTARGQAEPGHGPGEHDLRIRRHRTHSSQNPTGDVGIQTHPRPRASLPLPLARAHDSPTYGRGVVAGGGAGELLSREGGQLDVQVDTIEQRARQTPEVAVALRGRAEATIESGAAATARIGGRHELEACRKIADSTGARDGHPAILHRLPQRLEDVLLELGQLVQEEHALIRCAHSQPSV